MPKPSIIEDLTQFDSALREIAIIDLRVAEANVTRKDEILVAEGKFTSRAGLLLGRRELLAEQLELYYRANRAELEKGKKKSIELQFGRAGIKISAPSLRLLKKWTWGSVLSAITDGGLPWAGFTRTTKSVDKNALKAAKLTPVELEVIGLKLHQKEEFFFETFPTKGDNQ
jgi:phage host-nuclease inhibitor protein Gam